MWRASFGTATQIVKIQSVSGNCVDLKQLALRFSAYFLGRLPLFCAAAHLAGKIHHKCAQQHYYRQKGEGFARKMVVFP